MTGLLSEEAVKRGGLGESIAALILENNINCEFITIALENKFYPGGLRRSYAIMQTYLLQRYLGQLVIEIKNMRKVALGDRRNTWVRCSNDLRSSKKRMESVRHV